MRAMDSARDNPRITSGQQHGQGDALTVADFAVDPVHGADRCQIDTVIDRLHGAPAGQKQLLGLTIRVDRHIAGAEFKALLH